MAATYTTVEVWVLVDAAGNYVAHHDPDLLNESYEDNVQPVGDADGLRRVKLVIKVPLPEVIELTGEVQVEESGSELRVA